MRTESSDLPVLSVSEPALSATISVVIPAYNAAAYLGETLESIARQTLHPLEVVVVDDGSTDNTADVARSSGARVISQANGGISVARNTGTQAALGDYIAYMDSDDLWAPEKLAVQFAALATHDGPAFSFTDYRVFDELGVQERSGLRCHPAFRKTAKAVGRTNRGGNIVIADDGRRAVLPDCYIQPSSVMVRRADVLAAGGFDKTVAVSEDFEFFLRLFKIVPAIAVMQSLMLYRKHAKQETANSIKFKLAEFDIARRMVAAPDKYPGGDVRHMAGTDYVRYFRLGVEQARAEKFDEAVDNLRRSIAARRTLRAAAALIGARLCRSPAGRSAFETARTLWKLRRRQ